MFYIHVLQKGVMEKFIPNDVSVHVHSFYHQNDVVERSGMEHNVSKPFVGPIILLNASLLDTACEIVGSAQV